MKDQKSGFSMIIEGEKVSKQIEEELRLCNENPRMAAILVGENAASKSFIDLKRKKCESLGFEFVLKKFPENTDTKEVIATIQELNSDPEIHGILPQLPLPGIEEHEIFNTIRPEKDVDGLTPENLGRLQRNNPRIVPGTVEAITELMKYYDVETRGKDITIVNNSNLIGKPLSMALTNQTATVTLCHSKTRKLEKHTKTADILITATGQPKLIGKEIIKEDAVVIDAGYAKEDGKIQGDVNFDKAREKASKITPNPGGVGPITVAATMRNLLKCYKVQKGP